MSELKPCPFCGEKATLDYSVLPNRKHWFITCDCCGMMYQYTLSQRKYVKDGWNTRPIEDALNKRIAELEAAQRWIPVSERLPEATGDYIVTCDGWSNSEIAYWNFPDSDNPSGWLEYMQYIWSRKPVKYWMPLPKPPEVQE